MFITQPGVVVHVTWKHTRTQRAEVAIFCETSKPLEATIASLFVCEQPIQLREVNGLYLFTRVSIFTDWKRVAQLLEDKCVIFDFTKLPNSTIVYKYNDCIVFYDSNKENEIVVAEDGVDMFGLSFRFP